MKVRYGPNPFRTERPDEIERRQNACELRRVTAWIGVPILLLAAAAWWFS